MLSINHAGEGTLRGKPIADFSRPQVHLTSQCRFEIWLVLHYVDDTQPQSYFISFRLGFQGSEGKEWKTLDIPFKVVEPDLSFNLLMEPSSQLVLGCENVSMRFLMAHSPTSEGEAYGIRLISNLQEVNKELTLVDGVVELGLFPQSVTMELESLFNDPPQVSLQSDENATLDLTLRTTALHPITRLIQLEFYVAFFSFDPRNGTKNYQTLPQFFTLLPPQLDGEFSVLPSMPNEFTGIRIGDMIHAFATIRLPTVTLLQFWLEFSFPDGLSCDTDTLNISGISEGWDNGHAVNSSIWWASCAPNTLLVSLGNLAPDECRSPRVTNMNVSASFTLDSDAPWKTGDRVDLTFDLSSNGTELYKVQKSITAIEPCLILFQLTPQVVVADGNDYVVVQGKIEHCAESVAEAYGLQMMLPSSENFHVVNSSFYVQRREATTVRELGLMQSTTVEVTFQANARLVSGHTENITIAVKYSSLEGEKGRGYKSNEARTMVTARMAKVEDLLTAPANTLRVCEETEAEVRLRIPEGVSRGVTVVLAFDNPAMIQLHTVSSLVTAIEPSATNTLSYDCHDEGSLSPSQGSDWSIFMSEPSVTIADDAAGTVYIFLCDVINADSDNSVDEFLTLTFQSHVRLQGTHRWMQSAVSAAVYADASMDDIHSVATSATLIHTFNYDKPLVVEEPDLVLLPVGTGVNVSSDATVDAYDVIRFEMSITHTSSSNGAALGLELYDEELMKHVTTRAYDVVAVEVWSSSFPEDRHYWYFADDGNGEVIDAYFNSTEQPCERGLSVGDVLNASTGLVWAQTHCDPTIQGLEMTNTVSVRYTVRLRATVVSSATIQPLMSLLYVSVLPSELGITANCQRRYEASLASPPVLAMAPLQIYIPQVLPMSPVSLASYHPTMANVSLRVCEGTEAEVRLRIPEGVSRGVTVVLAFDNPAMIQLHTVSSLVTAIEPSATNTLSYDCHDEGSLSPSQGSDWSIFMSEPSVTIADDAAGMVYIFLCDVINADSDNSVDEFLTLTFQSHVRLQGTHRWMQSAVSAAVYADASMDDIHSVATSATLIHTFNYDKPLVVEEPDLVLLPVGTGVNVSSDATVDAYDVIRFEMSITHTSSSNGAALGLELYDEELMKHVTTRTYDVVAVEVWSSSFPEDRHYWYFADDGNGEVIDAYFNSTEQPCERGLSVGDVLNASTGLVWAQTHCDPTIQGLEMTNTVSVRYTVRLRATVVSSATIQPLMSLLYVSVLPSELGITANCQRRYEASLASPPVLAMAPLQIYIPQVLPMSPVSLASYHPTMANVSLRVCEETEAEVRLRIPEGVSRGVTVVLAFDNPAMIQLHTVSSLVTAIEPSATNTLSYDCHDEGSLSPSQGSDWSIFMSEPSVTIADDAAGMVYIFLCDVINADSDNSVDEFLTLTFQSHVRLQGTHRWMQSAVSAAVYADASMDDIHSVATSATLIHTFNYDKPLVVEEPDLVLLPVGTGVNVSSDATVDAYDVIRFEMSITHTSSSNGAALGLELYDEELMKHVTTRAYDVVAVEVWSSSFPEDRHYWYFADDGNGEVIDAYFNSTEQPCERGLSVGDVLNASTGLVWAQTHCDPTIQGLEMTNTVSVRYTVRLRATVVSSATIQPLMSLLYVSVLPSELGITANCQRRYEASLASPPVLAMAPLQIYIPQVLPMSPVSLASYHPTMANVSLRVCEETEAEVRLRIPEGVSRGVTVVLAFDNPAMIQLHTVSSLVTAIEPSATNTLSYDCHDEGSLSPSQGSDWSIFMSEPSVTIADDAAGTVYIFLCDVINADSDNSVDEFLTLTFQSHVRLQGTHRWMQSAVSAAVYADASMDDIHSVATSATLIHTFNYDKPLVVEEPDLVLLPVGTGVNVSSDATVDAYDVIRFEMSITHTSSSNGAALGLELYDEELMKHVTTRTYDVVAVEVWSSSFPEDRHYWYFADDGNGEVIDAYFNSTEQPCERGLSVGDVLNASTGLVWAQTHCDPTIQGLEMTNTVSVRYTVRLRATVVSSATIQPLMSLLYVSVLPSELGITANCQRRYEASLASPPVLAMAPLQIYIPQVLPMSPVSLASYHPTMANVSLRVCEGTEAEVRLRIPEGVSRGVTVVLAFDNPAMIQLHTVSSLVTAIEPSATNTLSYDCHDEGSLSPSQGSDWSIFMSEPSVTIADDAAGMVYIFLCDVINADSDNSVDEFLTLTFQSHVRLQGTHRWMQSAVSAAVYADASMDDIHSVATSATLIHTFNYDKPLVVEEPDLVLLPVGTGVNVSSDATVDAYDVIRFEMSITHTSSSNGAALGLELYDEELMKHVTTRAYDVVAVEVWSSSFPEDRHYWYFADDGNGEVIDAYFNSTEQPCERGLSVGDVLNASTGLVWAQTHCDPTIQGLEMTNTVSVRYTVRLRATVVSSATIQPLMSLLYVSVLPSELGITANCQRRYEASLASPPVLAMAPLQIYIPQVLPMSPVSLASYHPTMANVSLRVCEGTEAEVRLRIPEGVSRGVTVVLAFDNPAMIQLHTVSSLVTAIEPSATNTLSYDCHDEGSLSPSQGSDWSIFMSEPSVTIADDAAGMVYIFLCDVINADSDNSVDEFLTLTFQSHVRLQGTHRWMQSAVSAAVYADASMDDIHSVATSATLIHTFNYDKPLVVEEPDLVLLPVGTGVNVSSDATVDAYDVIRFEMSITHTSSSNGAALGLELYDEELMKHVTTRAYDVVAVEVWSPSFPEDRHYWYFADDGNGEVIDAYFNSTEQPCERGLSVGDVLNASTGLVWAQTHCDPTIQGLEMTNTVSVRYTVRLRATVVSSATIQPLMSLLYVSVLPSELGITANCQRRYEASLASPPVLAMAPLQIYIPQVLPMSPVSLASYHPTMANVSLRVCEGTEAEVRLRIPEGVSRGVTVVLAFDNPAMIQLHTVSSLVTAIEPSATNTLSYDCHDEGSLSPSQGSDWSIFMSEPSVTIADDAAGMVYIFLCDVINADSDNSVDEFLTLTFQSHVRLQGTHRWMQSAVSAAVYADASMDDIHSVATSATLIHTFNYDKPLVVEEPDLVLLPVGTGVNVSSDATVDAYDVIRFEMSITHTSSSNGAALGLELYDEELMKHVTTRAYDVVAVEVWSPSFPEDRHYWYFADDGNGEVIDAYFNSTEQPCERGLSVGDVLNASTGLVWAQTHCDPTIQGLEMTNTVSVRYTVRLRATVVSSATIQPLMSLLYVSVLPSELGITANCQRRYEASLASPPVLAMAPLQIYIPQVLPMSPVSLASYHPTMANVSLRVCEGTEAEVRLRIPEGVSRGVTVVLAFDNPAMIQLHTVSSLVTAIEPSATNTLSYDCHDEGSLSPSQGSDWSIFMSEPSVTIADDAAGMVYIFLCDVINADSDNSVDEFLTLTFQSHVRLQGTHRWMQSAVSAAVYADASMDDIHSVATSATLIHTFNYDKPLVVEEPDLVLLPVGTGVNVSSDATVDAYDVIRFEMSITHTSSSNGAALGLELYDEELMKHVTTRAYDVVAVEVWSSSFPEDRHYWYFADDGNGEVIDAYFNSTEQPCERGLSVGDVLNASTGLVWAQTHCDPTIQGLEMTNTVSVRYTVRLRATVVSSATIQPLMSLLYVSVLPSELGITANCQRRYEASLASPPVLAMAPLQIYIPQVLPMSPVSLASYHPTMANVSLRVCEETEAEVRLRIPEGVSRGVTVVLAFDNPAMIQLHTVSSLVTAIEPSATNTLSYDCHDEGSLSPSQGSDWSIFMSEPSVTIADDAAGMVYIFLCDVINADSDNSVDEFLTLTFQSHVRLQGTHRWMQSAVSAAVYADASMDDIHSVATSATLIHTFNYDKPLVVEEPDLVLLPVGTGVNVSSDATVDAYDVIRFEMSITHTSSSNGAALGLELYDEELMKHVTTRAYDVVAVEVWSSSFPEDRHYWYFADDGNGEVIDAYFNSTEQPCERGLSVGDVLNASTGLVWAQTHCNTRSSLISMRDSIHIQLSVILRPWSAGFSFASKLFVLHRSLLSVSHRLYSTSLTLPPLTYTPPSFTLDSPSAVQIQPCQDFWFAFTVSIPPSRLALAEWEMLVPPALSSRVEYDMAPGVDCRFNETWPGPPVLISLSCDNQAFHDADLTIVLRGTAQEVHRVPIPSTHFITSAFRARGESLSTTLTVHITDFTIQLFAVFLPVTAEVHEQVELQYALFVNGSIANLTLFEPLFCPNATQPLLVSPHVSSSYPYSSEPSQEFLSSDCQVFHTQLLDSNANVTISASVPGYIVDTLILTVPYVEYWTTYEGSLCRAYRQYSSTAELLITTTSISPSPSASPTGTPSPSQTSSPTTTKSPTPSGTSSISLTPSSTKSATPTPSASMSSSSTITPSLSATSTPSESLSPSSSPTLTPSPSSSLSSSQSPSPTRTVTPSSSSTSSPSESKSPTPSSSPTPSISFSTSSSPSFLKIIIPNSELYSFTLEYTDSNLHQLSILFEYTNFHLHQLSISVSYTDQLGNSYVLLLSKFYIINFYERKPVRERNAFDLNVAVANIVVLPLCFGNAIAFRLSNILGVSYSYSLHLVDTIANPHHLHLFDRFTVFFNHGIRFSDTLSFAHNLSDWDKLSLPFFYVFFFCILLHLFFANALCNSLGFILNYTVFLSLTVYISVCINVPHDFYIAIRFRIAYHYNDHLLNLKPQRLNFDHPISFSSIHALCDVVKVALRVSVCINVPHDFYIANRLRITYRYDDHLLNLEPQSLGFGHPISFSIIHALCNVVEVTVSVSVCIDASNALSGAIRHSGSRRWRMQSAGCCPRPLSELQHRFNCGGGYPLSTCL